MVQYIITLSKYFICIFMALYTLECFLTFRYKSEKEVKSIYSKQIVLILLFQFSSFLPICLKCGDLKYLLYYIGVQALLLTVVEAFPLLVPKASRLLINNAAMLIGVGFVILVRLDFDSAFKQLIIAVISFVLGAGILFVKIKVGRLKINYYYFAAAGFLLLLMVYLWGAVTNGSKLSVSVFGLSFQASEFVKILFVFFAAGSLYSNSGIKNLIITSLIAAAHVLMLVLSTDLGAALIFFVTYILMIYIATRNRLYLILGALSGCGCCVIGYKLFRHVRIRVLAYLDPFAVIDNEGYQITQSLFAINGGGLFGRGLFNGSPYSVPYVETDFIFSAIAEELGFIFSLCLILVCVSTFLMFVNISFGFMDSYYRLSAIGLGIVYIFQVFLNVGGNTGFIPLTGVTLPLVSCGGSSIMATIFTICIVQGLYATKPEYKATEENNRIVRGINRRQSGIILRIAFAFSVIFILLIGHLSTYMAVKNEDLFNNPYNPIQRLEAKNNIRGKIYSKDYDVLAETVIDLNSAEYRVYPYGRMFSHIVGYNIESKSGIEQLFNYYLTISNEPLSKKIVAEIDSTKTMGDSVVTTLDVSLQKVAYDAMGTFVGSVIISDPKTGDILAVVSKQDFNPETLEEEFKLLDSDKEADVLSNKAFRKQYENITLLKSDKLKKKLPEGFSAVSFSKVKNDTVTECVTPFELNIMTQAVANEGVLMEPRLVSAVINSKGNSVKKNKVSKYGRLYSKSTVEELTEFFGNETVKKWNSKYKESAYEIACITGGIRDGAGTDFSYFSGYGNYQDTSLCITVVLEGLGGNEIYAMNIAKKIFDTSFTR